MNSINLKKWLLGCCLLVLMGALAAEEEKQQSSDSIKDKLEKIIKAEGDKSKETDSISVGDADPMRPVPLPAATTDPKTRAAYEQAMQDYYGYRSSGLEHRSKVFKWQLFSAKTIFFVVIALVFCGLVFAGIQFRHGLKHGDVKMDSELEFGSSGFKISSPVLGVIILFLSLAFFYLYLVYVYPIENIF